MLKNHKLKYHFFDCIINLMGFTCQNLHRYIMMYYCCPIQISRHSIANAPGGVTGRGVLVFNRGRCGGIAGGLVAALSVEELAVQACDVAELDVLWALGGAGTGVGAVTEAELVHLCNHSLHAAFCLNLTLWK